MVGMSRKYIPEIEKAWEKASNEEARRIPHEGISSKKRNIKNEVESSRIEKRREEISQHLIQNYP